MWVSAWLARGTASAWPRFEDDAYYYLVIARNVAAGRGFTVDGISLTNGFQPLWMWLLVPVAWLCSGDTHVLLGLAQVFVVLLTCVSGGLLFDLLRTTCGFRPACFGTAVLLVPPFLNVLVSGMEAALVLLVFLLLVRELFAGGALERPEPRLRDLRAGVWLGLLLLARLDAVFVAVALAGNALLLGLLAGPASLVARISRTARKSAVLFGPAVLMLVPYLLWNFERFGHLVPISGSLKTSFSNPEFVRANVGLPWLALLTLGAAGAGLALARPSERRLGRLLVPLVAGLSLQALHAMWFMRWAVFAWHYVLFMPVGAVAAGVIARRLQDLLPEIALRAGLGLVAWVLIVSQYASISRLHLAFTGATREAGEWAAKTLPKDALFAMKDSGAFSYFSERGVVNLDGVVSSFQFQETLCRGELQQYLDRHHVAYLVQHSVQGLNEGFYDRFVLRYPCHFEGGHTSDLVVRRDQEVYRGSRYRDYLEHEDHLVIWKIAPDETP
ncbi:MAG TPA: hypothetical protein VMR86_16075 [Myxococcota bacterium]|nr:hypothetical protein [Myxococcota bacterium]